MPFSRICVPSTTRVSGIDTPAKSAACATDKVTTMTTAKINPRTMATRSYMHMARTQVFPLSTSDPSPGIRAGSTTADRW